MSDELIALLQKEGQLVFLSWTAEELQTYFAGNGEEISLERAETLLKSNGPRIITGMLVASLKQFRRIYETEFPNKEKEDETNG